ncbi:MAG: alanine racemase [Chloroflexota bacterium]|nr:alanine racemase [Chloroflexota bacterium]
MRRVVGDRVAVWAVVKADAYGHGAEQAARVFIDAGADGLCVATLDEALLLRRAGIGAPILVLFRAPTELVAEAAEAGLQLVIADEATVEEILRRWSEVRRGALALGELRLHVEVESGLARAGIRPDGVAVVARAIADTPGVRLDGLWTHFASGEDSGPTAEQLAAFERAAAAIRDAGLPLPRRHVAASLALFAGTAPHYDGVRPGLSLYGLLPAGFVPAPHLVPLADDLRPAMTLKCRPLRIETLAPGTGVGYGSHWRAERTSRIATLPVGYGDGWARASWPGSSVLVRGRRVPLVGTVAMDAVMADVTDVAQAGLEDEFVLLGQQGDELITAAELARLRNTISWEIVTAMAYRLPRVYHAGSVLMGVRTLAGEHRTHGDGK